MRQGLKNARNNDSSIFLPKKFVTSLMTNPKLLTKFNTTDIKNKKT